MRDPMGKPALEKKTRDLDDFYMWAREMANIKEGRYKPELHLFINPIIRSMAVILRNFTIVVTAVVRTRPRTIPLACLFYHEKSDSRVSMTMGHRVPALWAAGAPLL